MSRLEFDRAHDRLGDFVSQCRLQHYVRVDQYTKFMGISSQISKPAYDGRTWTRGRCESSALRAKKIRSDDTDDDKKWCMNLCVGFS